MSLGSRIGQADQQHLATLDLRYLEITSNLSDLNNVVTARSNLGLGSLAVENIDTTALTSYLKLTGSLAEVTNHSHTVLTDIGTNTHAQIDTHIAATGTAVHGLGTISTQASNNVSITGGSITGVTGLVWADIDKSTSNIADITTKSHTSLTDIGLYSHDSIDLHLADTSDPHGAAMSISTSLTSPLIIGGTGASSALTLKTTTGAGETGSDMHFLVGNNGATEAITILNKGRVGINVTAPTAILHLKAGQATASFAPLKFTSGALNTTAEAGAVEFLTDVYYGTITTGAVRKTFAFLESPIFTGTVTIPTPFTIGAVSMTATATELNILDGATLTTTELNYVDGVTSAIQTQIDGKAATNQTMYIGTTAVAINRASAALILTGITSIDGNAATVTTNANLTGPITSAGNATSIASQTGTGTKFVVDTSPTLVTPVLGVASATSLAVPALTTASGAMSITPAAGSNLNIALSTTGDLAVNTDHLYVDTSTGRVGIRTTTPGARLEVNETDAATNANVFVTARQGNELNSQVFFLTKDSAGVNAGGSIGSSGTRGSELAFRGSTAGVGTPHMVLDSSGNLGIGTTSPTNQLTIANDDVTNGQLLLRSNRVAIVTDNVLGGIEFQSNDTSLTAPGTVVAAMRVTAAGTHTATNLNTAFGFYVTDTNTATLNSYPAIYIQPSNLTDLRRDSTNVTAFGASHFRLQNLDATAATNHLINFRFDFYDTTGGTNRNAGGIIVGKEGEWTTTASTRDSFMSLHTSLNETVTEQLRITSAGNVGIGTTGPLAKLAINGGLNVGGDADPGDNNLTLQGQFTQATNVIRAVFTANLTDNVATNVFTITTTDEAGNTDGGSYSVLAHTLISDNASTAGQGAAKTLLVSWARAFNATGSGVNTAITEIYESASAATNASQRDIGVVTVSLVETSEYVITVQVTADHTGSLVEVLRTVVMVELVWHAFTTPPTLAAA